MKKINKILTLVLAGVSALTSGLMLSGCTTKKANIEDLIISSDNIPYVVEGRFNDAGIKGVLIYDNGTFKNINITEDMLSEADKLKTNTAGQYEITISYENEQEVINIEVIDQVELLDRLVQKTINNDFRLDMLGLGVAQYDAQNKILKLEYGNGELCWFWISNGYQYEYDDGDIDKEVYIETEWNDWLKANLGYPAGENEFNNRIAYSSVNSLGNYLVIIEDLNGDGEIEGTIEIEYNLNSLVQTKMEETTSKVQTPSINLEVPAEIKALESSAQ